MTIPLISTFLFPIAPTIGGMKGGEHNNPMCATVNKSPLTLNILEKNRCKSTDVTMIKRINQKMDNTEVSML